MAERVRITDVSPRDGLQNEAGIVPTSDKVALIQKLVRMGVDEVELTSFVSPKWVPQLADAEQVVTEIREWVKQEIGATGAREAVLPLFTALVPNEKGFERAMAFHDPAAGFPLKIALFTAASETFSLRNTNATIAQTIERFRPIVPQAVKAQMPIRLYVSCAISCPFENAIPPARVRRVVDALLSLFDSDEARSLAEIDLGDTIGVATPGQMSALLDDFDDDVRSGFTLHLHDTYGMAESCVRTALAMGVRSFDGAVAGLGGCPYASTPQRRAPGNISTELLVQTIQASGFETGVDDNALRDAAAFARAIVQRARMGGPPDRETPHD